MIPDAPLPRLLAGAMVLLLTSACTTAPNSDVAPGSLDAIGALLPDTVTIDGVLHMRHGADAFARAPQYTIDPNPLVTYRDGDDPAFDLTRVTRLELLSDGHAVAATRGGGGLLLFGSDGTPQRLLAPAGDGPGDVRSAAGARVIPGDTIVVWDHGNQRLSYFTIDDHIRSVAVSSSVPGICFPPTGLLKDHLVASLMCVGDAAGDTAYRLPSPVLTIRLRDGVVDTVVIAAGMEMVPGDDGSGESYSRPLRLGQVARTGVWDTLIAVGNGQSGFVLEQWTTHGRLVGRVILAMPRRAVTNAMRQRAVADLLAAMGIATEDTSTGAAAERRRVETMPIADSLPHHFDLIEGAKGTLWVTDYAVPGDSSRSATALRGDGAIVARLRIPGFGTPVWFGTDSVMLREVDDDGVVRFGLYRMVK